MIAMTIPAARPRGSLGLSLFLVATAAYLFSSWVLDPNNFFYADDWGWLGRAAFTPFNWLSDVWPGYIYNSRPAGEALITGLYHLFGLDHVAFHRVWLGIHMLNCMLYLLMLWQILPPVRALLAGILSACWHSSLMAVGWIGAAFDLVAATWCLAALLCYQQSARRGFAGIAASLAAAGFYMLALRSKEMAIALLGVFVAYEYLLMPGRPLRSRIGALLPAFVVFGAFGLRYLWLYVQMPSLPTNDPYVASIGLVSIASTFGFYLQQLSYATPTQWVWPAAAFAALGCYAILSRNRVAIFGLFAFVALLAAVLILPSQRSPLYLYTPHFFIAMALMAVMPRNAIATIVSAVFAALLVWWPSHTSLLHHERNFMLSNGRYAHQLWADYQRLPRAPAEFIRVDRPYFSPFQYGARDASEPSFEQQDQGTSINILRRDLTILVVVETDETRLLEAFCAHTSVDSRYLDDIDGRLLDRSDWATEQCR
jgi:hypothetical protein